jgi:hypothetical protein
MIAKNKLAVPSFKPNAEKSVLMVIEVAIVPSQVFIPNVFTSTPATDQEIHFSPVLYQ